jgi:cell division protein FtsW
VSGPRLFGAFPRGSAAGRSLLAATGLLVTFGTVAVASASEGQSSANGGSSWSITIHDLVYLGFGLCALYLASRVRLGALIRRAPLLAGAGLVSLVAVRAVGTTANGGKRWLNLHVIYLQPSEVFKLLAVLYLAWLVASRPDDLRDGRRLAVTALPVALGAGLIALEPDFGTASVVIVVGLATLAVAGARLRLVARAAALGAAALGAYMAAKPYAASRLFGFLHPSSDPLGSGYQLLQSKIGLGAGGVTGLGLGHSREKWGLLPNPHTDFIFTIVGEELGLIGTLCVLALFVWFLFAAVRIAQRAPDPAARALATGITAWICLEAVINVASVVGGWAVTGIPLPFFSYGGTALITELAAVGLLYNVAHAAPPPAPAPARRAASREGARRHPRALAPPRG